ncbi:MAG: phosphoglucosamine mutase [Prolixibacteraceae bacterium]|nr:phosphoglucosamine mutase [Prolixibacteraceae bacterium]
MSLIKSISGIRGTIGGLPGDGLTPIDVVKFTAAYAVWVKERHAPTTKIRVVVGRDARISGSMVNSLVTATLSGMGIDVTDIGLATTPTTELAVTAEKANGGIILTASHNPKQWNALKLLNEDGEFLNDSEGKKILALAEANEFIFSDVEDLGAITQADYLDYHIQKVLELKLVDVAAIRKAEFCVAIDAVNSVGGTIVPKLLTALGVAKIVEINCDPTGNFAHQPEPLPENLVDTASQVLKNSVDVCFVVDPDVDRLAIISENASMFNEEYTLVAVADYILAHTPGNTVSNLSSSRALLDVSEKHGVKYTPSAVGEVNVTKAMKETNAVIGGEGNGGIIYPESHYGRDALVGIGLFLTHLATSRLKCSELRAQYPSYFMAKKKIELDAGVNLEAVLMKIKEQYKSQKITDVDGVRIDFDHEWVHLRKSNTEPIIRIYSESSTAQQANSLADRIIADVKRLIN